MKVRDFLKSNAFKSIMVLMCIALFAGGILAIFSDVLKVSETEKIERAIKGIYGEKISFEEQTISNGENQYGSVEKVYMLSDGNYLIKAKGNNGYKNGTVTLWLVAEYADAEFAGLKKVVLAEYEKQTLMSSFGESFYKVYYDNDKGIISGKYFGTEEDEDTLKNVRGGATKSSNAINNAVNCGLHYIRAELNGNKEVR